MSEDWLVTSDRSVQVPELLQALEPWGQSVVLRAGDDESCTVVADRYDHAIAWVTPSVPVHDVEQIAQTYDLPTLNAGHRWWTEVVCPAGPFGALDPSTTTTALAHGLASSVGGEAIPLSSTGPSQRERRRAEPRVSEDTPCDVLTDDVAVFLHSRHTLALTAWMTLALAWAVQRGRVPVLLTPGRAELSPVLHYIARRGGCRWIRRERAGMTDALTGAPVSWDGNTFIKTGAATPELVEAQDWQMVIECDSYHLTADGAPIGQLSAAVHAACGLGPVRSWGATEPTGRSWDSREIAAQARGASPEVFRFLFRSPTAQGLSSVVPEPIGVREEVMVNVEAPELLPTHTDFARLGDRLLQAGCDIAIVSYQGVITEAAGRAATVGGDMPGLIAYRPSRFDSRTPHSLNLHSVPGAEVLSVESGVVICFHLSAANPETSSGDVLAAWWQSLRALADADALRGNSAARSRPVNLASSTAASNPTSTSGEA